MATLDIVCVSTAEPDIVMWIAGGLHIGELDITSVSDMVAKIKARCGSTHKLGELRVIGHGNSHGQYVGSDWLSDRSVNAFRSELGQLRPLFGSGGRFTLAGCHVGHNSRLLLTLSDVLCVPVRAFMAAQRPVAPGDQGRAVQCFITCTRGGSEFWEGVDEALGQGP
jgi:hypothetical protein